jgi:hypothetical protein
MSHCKPAIFVFLLLFLIILLTGCSLRQMPVTDDSPSADIIQQAYPEGESGDDPGLSLATPAGDDQQSAEQLPKSYRSGRSLLSVESPEPLGMPLMGTEVRKPTPLVQQRLAEAGFNLVRLNGLRWMHVEPQEGVRFWESMDALEQDLAALSDAGQEIILVIRDAPDWARVHYAYPCGPILEDKLETFASFVYEAVLRYSAPPYNVRYWELGNEPDVDHSLVRTNSAYGCWGDRNDDYYGGSYYAEMLKVVYPAIKAANPDVEVLIGGLLLDCDPTNAAENEDCTPARFLEGVLINGGGGYFDALSYHSYFHYWGSLAEEETWRSWEPRGGVNLGKIDFLREVTAAYGYEKPVFLTEIALLCPEQAGGYFNAYCNPPGEEFYEAQADYVVWTYIRSWASGLSGIIWFYMESPGWRNAAMLVGDQEPLPSYEAFRYMRKFLDGAGYRRVVVEVPQARVFEFEKDGGLIWIAWSPDDQPRVIRLPNNTVRVTDKYGVPISYELGILSVTSPVYIEINTIPILP